jgi:NTE family protein
MVADGIMRRFTLVLGGGGMRGLAHIGVLRALADRDLVAREVVGSSVGSLIAASWCAGMSIAEMRDLALEIKRDDLFQLAHGAFATRGLRAAAIYRPEPLAHFVRGVLGDITFEELEHPLLVNTVDINTGTQVFWGSPGLRDLPVADAVIASCALPGFLPPHEIRGHYFVDGAAAANLPVNPLPHVQHDLVIAADVSARGREALSVQTRGFISVYARAIEIGIQRMDEATLNRWTSPPLLLIRPKVWHIELLSFQQNAELIEAGFGAARDVLEVADPLPPPDAVGVYPRTRVRVNVARDKCVGCGACVVWGRGDLFRLDHEGKAVPTDSNPLWSAVDRLCVRECPTGAIEVERADGKAPRLTG